jgi:hypothetical protein
MLILLGGCQEKFKTHHLVGYHLFPEKNSRMQNPVESSRNPLVAREELGYFRY